MGETAEVQAVTLWAMPSPTSPYADCRSEAAILARTKEIISAHPLKAAELVEVVTRAWSDIFDSSFGPKGFKIGKDIFPKPQIMGFLLHELIPLELASCAPCHCLPLRAANLAVVRVVCTLRGRPSKLGL